MMQSNTCYGFSTKAHCVKEGKSGTGSSLSTERVLLRQELVKRWSLILDPQIGQQQL